MMLSQKNMMNPFYFQNMNFNVPQNIAMNMAPHPQNINGNIINNQNNPFFQRETNQPMMYGFHNPMGYNSEFYQNQDEDNQTNFNNTENN